MADHGTSGNRAVKRVRLNTLIHPRSALFLSTYLGESVVHGEPDKTELGQVVDMLCEGAQYFTSSADHPYWKHGLSAVDMQDLLQSIIHSEQCLCKICLGEYQTMINLPTTTTKTQGTETKKRGIPFLNTSELTPTPVSCPVIKARLVQDGNNDVEILLKHPMYGERIWGLRLSNPRLREIVAAWGNDETTWAGKSLHMFSQEDTFRGSVYIACSVTPEATSGNALPKPGKK